MLSSLSFLASLVAPPRASVLAKRKNLCVLCELSGESPFLQHPLAFDLGLYIMELLKESHLVRRYIESLRSLCALW